MEVTAQAIGHMAMEVNAHVVAGRAKIPVKKKRLDLLAVDRSGTAAAVGEDQAMMVSGALMLTASLRGSQDSVGTSVPQARCTQVSSTSR